MNRAEQVLWLVNELHRLDVEWGRPNLRWDPAPWLIGWIKGSVKPGNDKSDRQARDETQVAIEAYERFLAERAAELAERAEVRAAELVDEPRCATCDEPARLLASDAVDHCGDPCPADVKYEREDPVTGEPLPAGVDGFPAGGRG